MDEEFSGQNAENQLNPDQYFPWVYPDVPLEDQIVASQFKYNQRMNLGKAQQFSLEVRLQRASTMTILELKRGLYVFGKALEEFEDEDRNSLIEMYRDTIIKDEQEWRKQAVEQIYEFISGLNNNQLREELDTRQLETWGYKSELEDRLTQSLIREANQNRLYNLYELYLDGIDQETTDELALEKMRRKNQSGVEFE